MSEPVRGVATPSSVELKGTDRPGDGRRTEAAGTGAPQATPVDSVDVTQSQGLIETIRTIAGDATAVDPSRVAELQKTIADGSYRVDPQAVAEKIVESQQLLGKGDGSSG